VTNVPRAPDSAATHAAVGVLTRRQQARSYLIAASGVTGGLHKTLGWLGTTGKTAVDAVPYWIFIVTPGETRDFVGDLHIDLAGGCGTGWAQARTLNVTDMRLYPSDTGMKPPCGCAWTGGAGPISAISQRQELSPRHTVTRATVAASVVTVPAATAAANKSRLQPASRPICAVALALGRRGPPDRSQAEGQLRLGQELHPRSSRVAKASG